MDKIYLGQDFPINVTMENIADLSGATDFKIHRRDPDGILKSDLNLSVVDLSQGKLVFLSVAKEFNMIGEWNCWTSYVNAQGLDKIGSPFTVEIHKPGT
jgi:hypothetical protein